MGRCRAGWVSGWMNIGVGRCRSGLVGVGG